MSSVVSSLLTQILLCGSDEQKSDEIQVPVIHIHTILDWKFVIAEGLLDCSLSCSSPWSDGI